MPSTRVVILVVLVLIGGWWVVSSVGSPDVERPRLLSESSVAEHVAASEGQTIIENAPAEASTDVACGSQNVRVWKTDPGYTAFVSCSYVAQTDDGHIDGHTKAFYYVTTTSTIRAPLGDTKTPTKQATASGGTLQNDPPIYIVNLQNTSTELTLAITTNQSDTETRLLIENRTTAYVTNAVNTTGTYTITLSGPTIDTITTTWTVNATGTDLAIIIHPNGNTTTIQQETIEPTQ